MNNRKKKATTAALALGAVALIGAGATALFTDYETGNASAKAGSLDLVLTSVDGGDAGEAWITANDKYTIEDGKVGALGADGIIDAILPGGILDFDYKLANAGNKSMDVRETITITSASHEFTQGAEELLVYKASDVALNPATGAYKVNDGASAIPYELENSKKIVITPETFILDGTGTGDEVEKETGSKGDSYTMDYVILFRSDADNSWLGTELTVDYVAEAKQHRNTGGKDDWTVVDQMTLETATLAAMNGTNHDTLAVVPVLAGN